MDFRDANVVGDAADVGEQFADLLARFAEAFEAVLGAETVEGFALELGDLLALGEGFGHAFAGHFGELGFVVEGFEMGGAAGLVEEDDALGFGREVQGMHYALPFVFGSYQRAQQGIEREHAEGAEAVAEEGAAVVIGDSWC